MRVPIVNEQDEIIGYKERNDRDKNDIIRITGLWLWNEKGEALLAQRAFNKSIHPGLWGPAVAGTVEEGETYESNIIKEAEEEIGLKDLKPVIAKKIRLPNKFAQWFIATINNDYPFVKQDDEVESIKWFSRDELFKQINDKPEMFIPSLKESALYFFSQKNY